MTPIKKVIIYTTYVMRTVNFQRKDIYPKIMSHRNNLRSHPSPTPEWLLYRAIREASIAPWPNESHTRNWTRLTTPSREKTGALGKNTLINTDVSKSSVGST